MKLLVRVSLMLLVVSIFSIGIGAAADEKPAPKNEVLKQRDFVTMLVSAFHWQQGLPEKPRDNDYIDLLGGRRTFWFEAEDYYAKKTDNAFVKEYDRAGSFSGKGWVSGGSSPTTVHFSVLIPIEGDYLFTVAMKGDAQQWAIGGRIFKIRGISKFSDQVAGNVRLSAGKVDISVEMPADGGIDGFLFEASPLAPIEPVEGWRLDSPLTLANVAETAATLLDWEKGLREDPAWKATTISISEAVPLPKGVKTTKAGYMGSFVSKEWVRAGFEPAVLRVPLIIGESGAYDIKVRYLGETLVAELDGRKIVRPGKPYLDWVSLGLNRLKIGAHTLSLKLVPSGGIDVITLARRKSAPEDYLKLAGIDGNPADKVTRAQADKFITSFVERFKERR